MNKPELKIVEQTSRGIAVELRGVRKAFGERIAIDGVDLTIFKSEVFGILGPNGAGKSTLVRSMHCGAVPDSGEIYVLGLSHRENFRELKARIGVVAQDDLLDSDFSVVENLLVHGSYFQMAKSTLRRRTDEMLRLVHMEAERDSAVQMLSGGYRRRLAIAKGMIHNPEILFLDEPTTGLDPQARMWIWDLIRKVREDLGTIVLTTHYLEEAEKLCDRVALLDHGRILTIGTPMELIAQHVGKNVVELEVDANSSGYWSQRLKAGGYSFQTFARQIHVFLRENEDPKAIFDSVKSQRVLLRPGSLNDVYLRLTGRDVQEAEETL